MVGAGIFGLWQALVLSRRGHRVTLYESMDEPAGGGASRFAGAMLAPFCEAEAAEPIVKELGVHGLRMWRETMPAVVARGSLVLAAPRDHSELVRFQRATEAHRPVDAAAIAELEPDLEGRFSRGLFFETEAHVPPRTALAELVGMLRREDVELCFGHPVSEPVWHVGSGDDVVIDCRGMSARSELPSLRGVRGEMAVLHTTEVGLSRTVRLLHPRFPLYLVPWGGGLFMIGATVIEREDTRPVTARSALDLLGTAYAIHPAFAEAEIVELSAGVRPAFPDNVPKVVVRGRRLLVNGAYRHGYLLAPVLAEVVADHLETGSSHPLIVTDG